MWGGGGGWVTGVLTIESGVAEHARLRDDVLPRPRGAEGT